MSQNFTIDDTDATLVYGPGWGVASSNDSALGHYFENTYHATRTSGANVSLTFAGVAVYIYGSQGPDHGNFSVRFDSFVQPLSAHADTLSYRQLLFSTQLPSGNHSITLTNTDNSQSWLDVDFVTITGSGTPSTASGFSSTIPPPSIIPTTTAASSSSPSVSGSSIRTSSRSTSNTLTLALAIAFGALLLALVFGVVLHLIRRRYRRDRQPKYPAYDESTHNPPSVRSAGSAFLKPQSIKPSLPASRPSDAEAFSSATYPSQSQSHPTGMSGRPSDVEMRQWNHPSTGHAPAPARPWSPFASPLTRIFGGAKEGADSMKSTFLKV
ncbi:hypothetical protein JB92DRAFT_3112075 [Gautieria morchelliformis]|nr:hypothetical protein JB92DRAFT_3112075 [Gautieria morchelliformis]